MEKKNKIARIIRIINESTVIINMGKPYFNVDDLVKVYEDCGELTDLDGTYLGEYEYKKATLKVIEVCDTYSVCRNAALQKNRLTLAVSPLLENAGTPEALNVKESDIQPIEHKCSEIHIGDKIKSI